jgi:hypothetical protein
LFFLVWFGVYCLALGVIFWLGVVLFWFLGRRGGGGGGSLLFLRAVWLGVTQPLWSSRSCPAGCVSHAAGFVSEDAVEP